MTKEQRQTLQARAGNLRERIGRRSSVASTPTDKALASARRDLWCKAASKGDFAAFENMLVCRNIDPAELDQILSSSRCTNDTVAAKWIEFIDAVLVEAERTKATSMLPDASDVPFAEFYAPFCTVAHNGLVSALAAGRYTLPDTVHRTLTASLARSLHFVFRSALAVEQSVESISHGVQTGDDVSSQRHFSKKIRQPERLTRFLLEYSVAARAASTLMERWQQNTLEWVQRLASDTEDIARSFLAGAPLEELKHIECNLSDPHHGGKSVMRLHFSSGFRLIYKPRSVSLDLAYNNLMDWLERHGAPYLTRRPMYLARADYAWIEHIDHTPCHSQQELLQYCGAAGALLCVSYLLDATDLHDGNLIATTTSPVLIDLETLLSPLLAAPHSNPKQDALQKAAMLADHSILRTSLLPTLKAGDDGSVADIGCLGGLFGGQSSTWRQYESTASPLSETMHSAMASGVLEPRALVDRVSQGFAETYHFLMNKRDSLLDVAAPLQHFKNQTVRFVLRATTAYEKILESSFSPLASREGIDRSIVLESLYRAVHVRPEWPNSGALAEVVEAEIAALERLDVPLIHATTHSTALAAPHCASGSRLFEQPSYLAMLQRLRNFSEEDLAQQLNFLWGAFAARMADTDLAISQKPPAGIPANSPRSAHNGLDMARAFADELQQKAITGNDGSITWMAPVQIPGTGRFRFDVIPLNTEFGTLGIAFFLAAYSHTTDDIAAGTLARRAVQFVIQRLEIYRDSIPPGVGASLYCLQRIAVFLNDPEIKAAAYRLVQRLPDSQGDFLQRWGSVANLTELCLGLMALNEKGLAIKWGEQLFQHWSNLERHQQRVTVTTSPSLALCWRRLNMATSSEHYRDACSETIEIMREASEHDAAQAVNLHFAFLACAEHESDPLLDRWLSDSLASGCQDGSPVLYSYQNSARSVAERLITASRKLNQPKFLSAAQRILQDMMHRASSTGGYQNIPGMPPGTFFPGFRQGLSGIGYTLLRSQMDSELPCVELWD